MNNKLSNGLKITWLGHSCMLFETPGGKSLLADPWLMGNPKCPEPYKTNGVDKLDYMLISHGHFDHIGDAVTVAKATKATVVCVFETSVWLGKKGVENVAPMNKGGTMALPGSENITVTMVHADHSCGITDDDGSIIYGGEPCGYVITFENGYKVYFAGDTAVFGDMALIAELYQPDLSILPIGDRFVMSPKEAAKAIELLGAKRVVPMHFGTFPLLTGTPDALESLIEGKGVELLTLEPGETVD